MMKNNAVTMVMALGMLCVMLVGGIDISITSTLALAGMAIGMLLKYDHISQYTSGHLSLQSRSVLLRSCRRPGHFKSRRSAHYRDDGLHVYLPRHGLSCIPTAVSGQARCARKLQGFWHLKMLGLSLVIWIIIVCYVIFFIFMKWTRPWAARSMR